MKTPDLSLIVSVLPVMLCGLAFAGSEELITTKAKPPEECKESPINKTLLLEMEINGLNNVTKAASFYLNPCESNISETGFKESLSHNFIIDVVDGTPEIGNLVTNYYAYFRYNHLANSIYYEINYTYPSNHIEDQGKFIPLTSTIDASGVVRLDSQDGVLFKMPIGDKGDDEVELTYKIIN